MRETWVQFLGREDPLEKEMATHSSIHTWKIPGTEEPVGYSPWGRKESDTTEQLHFTSPQGKCVILKTGARIECCPSRSLLPLVPRLQAARNKQSRQEKWRFSGASDKHKRKDLKLLMPGIFPKIHPSQNTPTEEPTVDKPNPFSQSLQSACWCPTHNLQASQNIKEWHRWKQKSK